MSALLLLRAVTAAGLLAVADTLGVQRTADDLVADAGEVLHTTATHQHDRVLLQVVADARDVRGHLDLAAQLHPSDLAQRRVGLLGGGRVHARAHAAPLRTSLQRRSLGLARLRLAALADQLLDRGHRVSPLPSAASYGGRTSCSACVRRAPSRGPPAPAVGRVVRLTVPPRARTRTGSCLSVSGLRPTGSAPVVVLPRRLLPTRAHARVARASPGTRGKNTHRWHAGQNEAARQTEAATWPTSAMDISEQQVYRVFRHPEVAVPYPASRQQQHQCQREGQQRDSRPGGAAANSCDSRPAAGEPD